MRISDWSSDVCSSDLKPNSSWPLSVTRVGIDRSLGLGRKPDEGGSDGEAHYNRRERIEGCQHDALPFDDIGQHDPRRFRRSEEHTSELQSLMRISYAVFCLKKKKTTTRNRTHISHLFRQ